MEAALHRKILIYSAIAAVISMVGVILLIVSGIEEFAVSILFLGFSIIAVIASFAMRFREKRFLRRIAKFSIYLFPLCVFVQMFVPYESIFYPVMIIICILIGISALLQIFVYAKADSFIGIAVFLILMVAGIFFKKNHFRYSGILVSLSMFMTSIGSVMLGIKYLYLNNRDAYFNRLALFGNIILAFALLGQLFKMQHWPGAGVIIITGFGLIILGTLYVLVTIQSSGFIDWPPLYRKIFRNLIIPWFFVFLLYAARFMIPELNNLLFISEPVRITKTISPYGFGMKDYVVTGENEVKP